MSVVRESDVQKLLFYKQRLQELNSHWQATEQQKPAIKAINNGCKRIFIRGGRKSGKTEFFLYMCARIAGLKSNAVVSIVGPSLKTQRKILWNNHKLENMIPKPWGVDLREFDSMARFPNGSFIEVDGSESAPTHAGEEQDLLVLDELADHSLDSFEIMYPNLLARDGILIVVGSPPRGGEGELYLKLEEQAKRSPRWEYFKWSAWNNPHVSQQWLIDEKGEYYARGDGHIWEREYEANDVFGGKGAVFSMFSDEKHVLPHDVLLSMIEKDRHKLEYFIVSDPGNRICHANLFVAFNPSTNDVWVLDEIYETTQANTATSLIVPRIMQKAEELFPVKTKPYWIYDEAALWFVTEVGALFPDTPPMSPTNKSANDKETSIGMIKTCMLNGQYHQSDRCVGLLGEIKGYYLDDKGNYVKKKDHALDGLRYVYDFVGMTYRLKPEGEVLADKERQEEMEEVGNKNSLEEDFLSGNILDDEDSMIWN